VETSVDIGRKKVTLRAREETGTSAECIQEIDEITVLRGKAMAFEAISSLPLFYQIERGQLRKEN